ncbi:PREDICTED: proline-rich receptor-like protein kinase PERK8 [Ipomoea nil]|uniref:proline-rich receptor-like protein kinase PERK8 n=1 Tax=Ipomoea nil TaxID=35883 RepID=UPI000901C2BD|nr:PREDICTED: proline-rich receptor-like protein kinase PERK8 [Ipomoea nil]
MVLKEKNNEERRTSKRIWNQVRLQKLRARRVEAGGHLVGDTANDPLVVSEEKGPEQYTPVSPPREPGFIYAEEGDAEKSLPPPCQGLAEPQKSKESEGPFLKFSPVVQSDIYQEIMNMSNTEYIHYLKQLTFGPVLPPPGFEGISHEPLAPPVQFDAPPAAEPDLPPVPPELVLPSAPPPVNPRIRPPVNYTRFFNATYSSSSSNMHSEDSGPGYCPSPPHTDEDNSEDECCSTNRS